MAVFSTCRAKRSFASAPRLPSPTRQARSIDAPTLRGRMALIVDESNLLWRRHKAWAIIDYRCSHACSTMAFSRRIGAGYSRLGGVGSLYSGESACCATEKAWDLSALGDNGSPIRWNRLGNQNGEFEEFRQVKARVGLQRSADSGCLRTQQDAVEEKESFAVCRKYPRRRVRDSIGCYKVLGPRGARAADGRWWCSLRVGKKKNKVPR